MKRVNVVVVRMAIPLFIQAEIIRVAIAGLPVPRRYPVFVQIDRTINTKTPGRGCDRGFFKVVAARTRQARRNLRRAPV